MTTYCLRRKSSLRSAWIPRFRGMTAIWKNTNAQTKNPQGKPSGRGVRKPQAMTAPIVFGYTLWAPQPIWGNQDNGTKYRDFVGLRHNVPIACGPTTARNTESLLIRFHRITNH